MTLTDWLSQPWFWIVDFYNWVFRKGPGPATCWVESKEGTTVDMVPGWIINPKTAVVESGQQRAAKIRYTWINGIDHEYIQDLDTFVGMKNGLPIFVHNLGALYAAGVTQEFISSDWYAKFNDTKIIAEAIDAYEEYSRGNKIPWLKYAIWVAIFLIIVFLWKNGTIPNLLQGLGINTDTANATAPAAPAAQAGPAPDPLFITPAN